MNARQQRGLEIADKMRIRKETWGWIVPSQSGPTKYAVMIAAGVKPKCTCPDYELRGDRCKHIYAVEYVIQRELNFDGSETVTASVKVTETVKRTTYPQNWRAYNKAQTTEKDRFMVLLRDLCAGLPEPPQQRKRGRPRLSLRDAVFTAVFKVYTTVSARRCMSDLREAHERGYIGKLPCHNSVLNALESADMTAILHDLIVESSLPLKAVESDFAVDSSGFTTSRFESWFGIKYGPHEAGRRHTWVKAHIMCGTKTNVVTAIEIQGKNAADVKQLPALVASTSRNFAIAEVSADKAYGSVRNADAIASVGATPFIAFKTNNTGVKGFGAWSKMFGYFTYRRDEFLAHYHKRSNVESTFSMIKRKFGDSLRSKTETAQVNETLAKVLCHNLVVLIHEMYELGVDPVFWGDNPPMQQPVA